MDDASALNARAEEERKERLRRRLDILFGIAPSGPAQATPALDVRPRDAFESLPGTKLFGGWAKNYDNTVLAPAQAQLNAQVPGETAEAEAARVALEAERTRLSNAL